MNRSPSRTILCCINQRKLVAFHEKARKVFKEFVTRGVDAMLGLVPSGLGDGYFCTFGPELVLWHADHSEPLCVIPSSHIDKPAISACRLRSSGGAFRIACGHLESMVSIWTLSASDAPSEADVVVTLPKGRSNYVCYVECSDTTLYAAYDVGTVFAVDIASGRVLRQVCDLGSIGIMGLYWSSNCLYVSTGSAEVIVFDTEAPETEGLVLATGDEQVSCMLKCRGKLFLGLENGAIAKVSVDRMRQTPIEIGSIPGHRAPLGLIALDMSSSDSDSDSTFVSVAGEDVMVFNKSRSVWTGQLPSTCATSFTLLSYECRVPLIVSSFRKELRYHDVSSGERIWKDREVSDEMPQIVKHVVALPEFPNLVAVVSANDEIVIRNVVTQETIVDELYTMASGTNDVIEMACVVGVPGGRLAVGTNDGVVAVFDLEEEIRLRAAKEDEDSAFFLNSGFEFPISDLKCDGRGRIVVVCASKAVQVWNLEDKKLVASVEQSLVRACAVDSVAGVLYTSGGDTVVKRNLQTLEEQSRFAVGVTVQALGIRDSQSLVVLGNDSSVLSVNTASGDCSVLRAPEKKKGPVCLSQSSTVLATGVYGEGVCVWRFDDAGKMKAISWPKADPALFCVLGSNQIRRKVLFRKPRPLQQAPVPQAQAQAQPSPPEAQAEPEEEGETAILTGPGAKSPSAHQAERPSLGLSLMVYPAPERNCVIATTGDGKFLALDSDSGKLIKSVELEDRADGTVLLSGSYFAVLEGDAVTIWDANEMRKVGMYVDEDEDVTFTSGCFVFPDRIAVATINAVRLFSIPEAIAQVDEGAVSCTTLSCAAPPVPVVSFAAESGLLFAACGAGVMMWDLKPGGSMDATTIGPKATIHSLVLDDTEKFLYVATHNKLSKWDVASRKLVSEVELPAFPNRLLWNPTLQSLLVVVAGGRVFEWKDELKSVKSELKLTALCPLDVSVFVAVMSDKTIQRWTHQAHRHFRSVWSSEPLETLATSVCYVGRPLQPPAHILSSGLDEHVRFHRTTDGVMVFKMACDLGKATNVARITDDLVALSKDSKLALWSIPENKALATLNQLEFLDDKEEDSAAAFAKPMLALGRKYLATASVAGVVRIWDVDRAIELNDKVLGEDDEDELKGDITTAVVLDFAWSEARGRLYIGDLNGAITVYDPVREEPVDDAMGTAKNGVVSLATDGMNRLFSAGDNCVKVWDATALKSMVEIEYKNNVERVLYLPDADALLSFQGEGTVAVHDVRMIKERVLEFVVPHPLNAVSVCGTRHFAMAHGRFIELRRHDGSVVWKTRELPFEQLCLCPIFFDQPEGIEVEMPPQVLLTEGKGDGEVADGGADQPDAAEKKDDPPGDASPAASDSPPEAAAEPQDDGPAEVQPAAAVSEQPGDVAVIEPKLSGEQSPDVVPVSLPVPVVPDDPPPADPAPATEPKPEEPVPVRPPAQPIVDDGSPPDDRQIVSHMSIRPRAPFLRLTPAAVPEAVDWSSKELIVSSGGETLTVISDGSKIGMKPILDSCVAVASMAQSRVAVATSEQVSVYNSRDNVFLADWPVRPDDLLSLVHIPLFDILAGGCEGGVIKIWDVMRMLDKDLSTPTAELMKEDSALDVVALGNHPESPVVFSGAESGVVVAWDVAARGRVVGELKLPTGAIRDFTAAGKLLLCASGRAFSAWQVGNFPKAAFHVEAPHVIEQLVALGSQIVSFGGGRAHMWDLRSRSIISTFDLGPTARRICAVDASRFAVATDKTVELWKEGKSVWSCPVDAPQRSLTYVKPVDLLSEDSEVLASDPLYLDAGGMFVYATQKKEVRRVDLPDMMEYVDRLNVKAPGDQDQEGSCQLIHVDKGVVATASGSRVSLWSIDPFKPKCLSFVVCSLEEEEEEGGEEDDDESTILCLAKSHDGQCVYAGTAEGEVFVLGFMRLGTEETLQNFSSGEVCMVPVVSIAPSKGRKFWVLSAMGVASEWDAVQLQEGEDGAKLREFKPGLGVTKILTLFDFDWIFTVGSKVQQWNPADLKAAKVTVPTTTAVTSMCLMEEGFVLGQSDGTVLIKRVEELKTKDGLSFKAHNSTIDHLVAIGDDFFATVSVADKKVKVWSRNSLVQEMDLPAHFSACVFIPEEIEETITMTDAPIDDAADLLQSVGRFVGPERIKKRPALPEAVLVPEVNAKKTPRPQAAPATRIVTTPPRGPDRAPTVAAAVTRRPDVEVTPAPTPAPTPALAHAALSEVDRLKADLDKERQAVAVLQGQLEQERAGRRREKADFNRRLREWETERQELRAQLQSQADKHKREMDRVRAEAALGPTAPAPAGEARSVVDLVRQALEGDRRKLAELEGRVKRNEDETRKNTGILKRVGDAWRS